MQEAEKVEYLEVTVKVTKEAYELMQGIVSFTGKVKKALDDGWQPGEDIPVMLTGALTDLAPAVQGASKLGLEVEQDRVAFTRSLAIGSADMVDVFTTKAEA